MSSYVEKVLDFLEKHTVNPDVPKHLQEDIQWAIDIISANKLYAGSFEGFRLSEDRIEVKAWTDMIELKNLSVNKKDVEHLKKFEGLEQKQAGKMDRKLFNRSKVAAMNETPVAKE